MAELCYKLLPIERTPGRIGEIVEIFLYCFCTHNKNFLPFTQDTLYDRELIKKNVILTEGGLHED